MFWICFFILIASRPPAAVQGFRDPGLSTFNCFNFAGCRSKGASSHRNNPHANNQKQNHHDQPQSKTTKTTRTTTPKQPRTAPKWVENGIQKAPKVLPGGLRPAGGVLGGPWEPQGRCLSDFGAHLGAHLGLRNRPKMVRK